MILEATMAIPDRKTQPDQLTFYVDALGGVAAAALWLEVSQHEVRSWLAGSPAPADTLFWLDEAFGDLDAPSGEE